MAPRESGRSGLRGPSRRSRPGGVRLVRRSKRGEMRRSRKYRGKLLPSYADAGSRRRLGERYDDFAGVGVSADVLVSGGILPQPIEDTIDRGLESSRG